MNISASTLYYRRSHPRRVRYSSQERDAVLGMFRFHLGSFGRRVLHNELAKADVHISEHRISRILKDAGVRSKYGRKKCRNVHTNKETAEKYIAENLYRALGAAAKSMDVWSMDFTEEKIEGRKVITCGIVSVNGKQLIARVSDCRNSKEAALETLRQGLERFGKPDMVMSDRGSPFVSKAFHDELEMLGIRHSMSRAHTPVDNCFIETFWKSMKTEIGKVRQLSVERYLQIMEYYEYYYNYLRPHSALAYRPPLPRPCSTVI